MSDFDATSAAPTAPESGGGEAATPTDGQQAQSTAATPQQASQDPGDWGAWLETAMSTEGDPGAEDATGTDADPASDGETVTSDATPGNVPYERFQEVVRARQELEAQLGQFQGLQAWGGAVEALGQLGYTPEQIAAYAQSLRQGQAPQAQQLTPEQQFQAWADEQGVDLYSAEPAEVRAMRAEFQVAQIRQELRQQQEAAQQAQEAQRQREYQAQVAAEIQTLTSNAQDPLKDLWADPQMQTVLRVAHEALGGQASVAAIAQQIAKPILAQQQAQLARYAAGKRQDGAVPVVAGGSAPPPVQPVDVHRMNATQAQDTWQSALEALSAQV